MPEAAAEGLTQAEIDREARVAKVRQATAMDSYGLIGKADAALFLAESEAEALAEAHAEAVAATKLQAGARGKRARGGS